ncbi:3'-5' exonuclease [Corynebacterium sp. TAE3-ERU12]|uniref:3'-5' exonuclease n=1 Tax=Corynebacterium sp. TAE3-ERU12 TaxID=2849491 RepID=UPI001C4766FF|nr:3'-5' exonuclease [Corynebacterium sp. TAE3-ERU12]MBV7295132.1 3'-5' exonuclease [Corynebacterium sp. TAE3-ERU12]
MSRFDVAKMVAFDLETTGTDPLSCKIVTSALVRLTSGKPQSLAMLADPGVEIPEAAAKVHGITTEKARAEGQPHDEVLQRTIAALRSSWQEGYTAIIYNAAYDLSVLHALDPTFTVDGLVVDPFVLDKKFTPRVKGAGQRKLGPTCERYGVRLDNAHDATEDSLAAARLAWVMAKKHPEITEMDGDELMEMQAIIAYEQAKSFREYLQSQGKSGADVDGSWPLRTH